MPVRIDFGGNGLVKTIRTIRGKNLTQIMLDDFAPYLPYLRDYENFRDLVRRTEKEYGCPVTRIEWLSFGDGRPGIMEKRYFHEADPEDVSDCLDWELNAVIVDVDSL